MNPSITLLATFLTSVLTGVYGRGDSFLYLRPIDEVDDPYGFKIAINNPYAIKGIIKDAFNKCNLKLGDEGTYNYCGWVGSGLTGCRQVGVSWDVSYAAYGTDNCTKANFSCLDDVINDHVCDWTYLISGFNIAILVLICVAVVGILGLIVLVIVQKISDCRKKKQGYNRVPVETTV